jgi:hypothetical protein
VCRLTLCCVCVGEACQELLECQNNYAKRREPRPEGEEVVQVQPITSLCQSVYRTLLNHFLLSLSFLSFEFLFPGFF